MNRVLTEALGKCGRVGAHHRRSNVSVTTSIITTSSASVWPSGAVHKPFAGERTYAVTPLNLSASSCHVSASGVMASLPPAPGVGNSS
jgi:hypothetical protein